MTSKAQMALEQAINKIENEWGYEGIKEEMNEIMHPILKDLERLEKQDKMLEIIKKKNVDFDTLTDSETLDDYNLQINWSYRKITQEEYDLIKECLDSEI